jgi:hypothetical protein
MGLLTGIGDNDVALPPIPVTGLTDPGTRGANHHVADCDRISIGFGVTHASPHMDAICG